jgi:hypothetical protein
VDDLWIGCGMRLENLSFHSQCGKRKLNVDNLVEKVEKLVLFSPHLVFTVQIGVAFGCILWFVAQN